MRSEVFGWPQLVGVADLLRVCQLKEEVVVEVERLRDDVILIWKQQGRRHVFCRVVHGGVAHRQCMAGAFQGALQSKTNSKNPS